MLDILKYFFFFLGICGGIILLIALINIYTKSYRPKNSLIVIIGLIIIFVLNGVFAIDALNRTLGNLNIDFINPGNNNTLPANYSF
jgi:hypothetical protein